MNRSSDHRRATKVGLAIAAALLAIGAAGQAHAVELDYAKIARINRDVNASFGHLADQPICGALAVNKAYFLMLLYPSADVSIDIVTDERGQLHAVAEIRGEIKGRPGAYVLDSHYPFPEFRADLEAAGYRWVQKFSGPIAQP